MMKGTLSSVPAPYVYIDGESLFEKTLFRVSPKAKYAPKLSKIIRELNIAIFLDKDGKVREGDLAKSPFLYTRAIECSVSEIVKLLREERQAIFIGNERRAKFSAYGVAYLLDATTQEIIDGVRLCSTKTTSR